MTRSNSQDHPSADGQDLQRSLSNRHIQLIAIGGAIGTGLFMGSGKTISPVSYTHLTLPTTPYV